MSKARNLARLIVDSGGDVDSSALNAVPFITGRNRIINGDMRIDQRNNGASVTITATSTSQYVLDRFYLRAESASGSKISVQRSTVAPAGFTNSMLLTSLSAYTLGVSEHFATTQPIEGFNSADFAWGTDSGQSVTVSFWVRSSLTGTFGGHVNNSNSTMTYVFSYAINAANTWEQKTITVPAPPTSTWLSNQAVGLYLTFSIGAGSSTTRSVGWGAFARSVTGQTSLVGTSGATFYITGVQLEAGSVATPFERRPYGTELQLCRRYFQYMPALQGNFIVGGSNVFVAGAADTVMNMRATPTGIVVNGTDAIHVSNLANYSISSISDINQNYFRFNTTSGAGAYAPGHFNIGSVTLSSEL